MPDQPVSSTENPETQTQQGDPAESTADLGDPGKKAIEAERRERKAAERKAATLQAQLDELNAANLTELERAQRAANEATARLAEYEKTTIRQRVALNKGVPADLVDRLRGDTEDEITADADALMALVGAPKSPRPDPSQGPRATASGTTADQFAAALQGHL